MPPPSGVSPSGISTREPAESGTGCAAIVTGGAGDGIGSGITGALVRRGWGVVVVDRDADATAGLQRSLGTDRVEILVADITAENTPALAVERALRRFGRLDGLVNNAGIGLVKPTAEIADADFDRLLDVDFRAAFRFCRAAIPPMLTAGGAIVNIGSVHARQTIRGYGAYAAVKSGLEGLTRGIAADYGPQGIRANCIHPGLVMSPQNRALIAAFASDPDAWLKSFLAKKQLVPRFVTAREVGEMTALLLGSDGVSITGQSITIDGGSSAMLYEREASS